MTVERITYVDSSIMSDQTHQIAKPTTVVSVGFVIAEDDDSVTLAGELIGAYEEYRAQVAIPKVAITDRRAFRLRKARP